MNCESIKKLMPIYLEGELQPQESKEVKDHLASCLLCQKEISAFERSWDMLDEIADIEPAPDYVSRFWTELSLRTPWHEAILKNLSAGLSKRPLVPVLATTCIMIIVGFLSIQNYFNGRLSDEGLAHLNEGYFEMVANMELIEHYEIIEDIDFLVDLEVIENLDVLEGEA